MSGCDATRFMPLTMASGVSARSAFSASAPSAVMPALAAKATPSASADGDPPAPGWLIWRIEMGPRDRPPPDSTIALWNRPFAIGEIISALTDPPPADSPKIVTFAGSPPNAAALRFTHCSAAS